MQTKAVEHKYGCIYTFTLHAFISILQMCNTMCALTWKNTLHRVNLKAASK